MIDYNDVRIGSYYDDAEARLARVVLDVLAVSNGALPMPEIVNLVRHRFPDAGEDAVRSICILLRQDHYLSLSRTVASSGHDFRWPILKRWWRENRL